MATKPRAWPNNAAWARDEAKMAASEALKAIVPVLRGDADRAGLLRVLALTVNSLHRIIQVLNDVS